MVFDELVPNTVLLLEVKIPVVVSALLIIVFPELAPIDKVVVAPPKLIDVAVVLSKLTVVCVVPIFIAFIVKVLPATPASGDNVILPVVFPPMVRVWLLVVWIRLPVPLKVRLPLVVALPVLANT